MEPDDAYMTALTRMRTLDGLMAVNKNLLESNRPEAEKAKRTLDAGRMQRMRDAWAEILAVPSGKVGAGMLAVLDKAIKNHPRVLIVHARPRIWAQLVRHYKAKVDHAGEGAHLLEVANGEQVKVIFNADPTMPFDCLFLDDYRKETSTYILEGASREQQETYNHLRTQGIDPEQAEKTVKDILQTRPGKKLARSSKKRSGPAR